MKRGFTLVELLVTVTIIAILAGVVLAALNAARQTARAAKTKATIAKLDQVIMRRYDSYMTRRVPISTSGLNPNVAAQQRINAIRELMRMEMPEWWTDVTTAPSVLTHRSAMSQRYLNYHNSINPDTSREAAECLYMIVAIGNTTDLELFSQSEIGDGDGDGAMEFLDGWGNPIHLLRWVPGFTSYSDIQTGDPQTDHDAFDPMNLYPNAYQLYPLIFSSGSDGEHGIAPCLRTDINNPWTDSTIGVPDMTGDHYDNIHNHRIEAR